MKEIDEKIYLPTLRWTEVVQMVDSLDQDIIETITPMYVLQLQLLIHH